MKKRRRKFSFKISQKLALVCIGLCLSTISILTLQYYNYSRNMLEQQTQQYIFDMLKQTGNNLDMVMEDVQTLIFNIQKEPDVQSYLTQLQSQSMENYEEYLNRKELVEVIYKYILYDDNIESVLLVPENGKPELISKTMKDYSVDSTQKSKVYEAGGSAVWLGVNSMKRSISVGAQVNSLKTMESLGYMIIQVSERKFSDNFIDLGFVKNGSIFIVNQEDMIVSSNNVSLLNESLDNKYGRVINKQEKQKFQVVSGNENEKKRFHKLSGDKPEEYVAYSQLNFGEWKLMTVIPVVSYGEVLIEMRQYFASIFVILSLVIAVMSIVFTKSFSKPILKLLHAMQEFGNGDFNVICNVTSSDEIGLLSQNFNMMVYNINDLVEEVYTETMLKQEAELRSLRMQINPHFLYNTLETINWISRDKGVEEIGVIAKSLGDMMYYTINGSDFTSVEDEVKNINDYLIIQKVRYEDRIIFEVDIPEELYQYKLPKLMLQPLIENAIIHGVEEKGEIGQIVVKGWVHNHRLFLSIIDNGVGMDGDKVKKLLSKDVERTSEGKECIGLRNVNQRLCIYYGEQRGLKIYSILGVGTEVMIEIPLQT